MIGVALIVSIVAATAGISAAFMVGSLWIPAAAIVLLGIVWAGARRARGDWIAWTMMGLFTVVAAAGAWLELRPVFLVIGLTAAVSAWDLDHFRRQLDGADLVERRTVLSQRHLRRLALVDAISIIAAAAALNVRVELSFAVAVLLGLVALIALSRTVSFIRRDEGA